MIAFGSRVYGLGAFMLGVVGLVWGDFALVWQPVPASLPGRTALAYATGAALTVAGAAVNWHRTVAFGAASLAILYAMGVVLLHGPHVIAHPSHFGPWAGIAEQLALVAGGLVAYASSANIEAALAARLCRVGRVAFGACALLFGLVHFLYATDTASMVPKWMPAGPLFWAYATGAAHVAAGLAILTGVQARLAAGLLTVMFAAFGVLVHIPLAFADPASHLNWVMNAMNLALTGAAWVVADSLAGRRVTAQSEGGRRASIEDHR
jgi:uncharacterized membrane protein YphA (DoxX/SURF4 family)